MRSSLGLAVVVLMICAVILPDAKVDLSGRVLASESDFFNLVSVVFNSSTVTYPPGNASPYGPEISPVYNMTKEAVANLNFENPENPLSNIITPGDVVVIKPNLVSASSNTDEKCTKTPVIRPLVDLSVLAGASKVIIAEGPSRQDLEDVVFGPDYSNITGLVEALQAIYPGVSITYINLNQDRFTWIALGENSNFYGDYAADQLFSLDNIRMDDDSYYYAEDSQGVNPRGFRPGLYAIANTILEADVFINAPKMKIHHITGVTLSLKNLVGITVSSTGNTTNEELVKDIPHWNNSASHANEFLTRQDSFENDVLWRIASDLNTIALYADKNGALRSTRQRKYLSVVDGIRGMEGPTVYGPPGIPKPTGVIVAGEDPAAVDAVCCRVMGFNYTIPSLLRIVGRDGYHPIGTSTPTETCVIGTSLNSTTFGEPYVPHVNYEDDQIAPYKIRLQQFDPPDAKMVKTEPDPPREGVESKIIVSVDVDVVASGWLRYSINGATSMIMKLVSNGEALVGNLGYLEEGTHILYEVCLQDYFFNTEWGCERQAIVGFFFVIAEYEVGAIGGIAMCFVGASLYGRYAQRALRKKRKGLG